MNVKRLLLAALAVFVTFQVTDFVVHNLFLSAEYEASIELWRPEMMDLMWMMFIANIVLSLFFTFVFAKGYEGKGLLEGVRYGLIIGVGYHFVRIISQYVIYPIPTTLMIKWLVFGLIQFILAGIVVSLVYKPK